jgi:hypothetical protein
MKVSFDGKRRGEFICKNKYRSNNKTDRDMQAASTSCFATRYDRSDDRQ